MSFPLSTRNEARHELLRQLVKFADESPLWPREIERKAGIGRGVLGQWRRNRYGANFLTVICIGEALGYELVWQKKNGLERPGPRVNGKTWTKAEAQLRRETEPYN